MITLTLMSLVLETREELSLESDYQLRVSITPEAPLHLIPREGGVEGDYAAVPPPPVVEAEWRLSAGPDVGASDALAFGLDLNSMVERHRSALEGFWELPNGTRPDHPVREMARRFFGGEPDHPLNGRTMS